jgi:hypothetical protein
VRDNLAGVVFKKSVAAHQQRAGTFARKDRKRCFDLALTMEEEDARRPSRERECLVNERSRITNRMKSALTRLGRFHLRTWPDLAACTAPGGRAQVGRRGRQESGAVAGPSCPSCQVVMMAQRLRDAWRDDLKRRTRRRTRFWQNEPNFI